MFNYKELLAPYSPWLAEEEPKAPSTPNFRRPLFRTLVEDLERIPQILSITGPRRIGKTTLLHQLIADLLGKGIPPHRVVYYSLDDPALSRRGLKGEDVIERIMKEMAKVKDDQPAHVFLDEIQRLDRWELYIKKYYDLKFPVRIVLSGSASSPIFKKSRESLLGRVKDYHLLPFSFREFLLYRLEAEKDLRGEVEDLHERGKQLQGMVSDDPHLNLESATMLVPSPSLCRRIQEELERYFLEGGFPEVWSQPDWVKKQEYLFDNQVKKVIYEDLVLAAEFRKPELLKRFYISLLETPGREVNVQKMAGEVGTSAAQIEKYLPLLEMTDLVYHLDKFRKSPLRVRKGKMKFYLVDLALRNAVLRLAETLVKDQATLGLYAENLVFLALRKWRGAVQMDYYRERDVEADFIVHVGSRSYLPIEVKYRESIDSKDLTGIHHFRRRFRVRQLPLLVTKRWEDFGPRDNIFWIPLPLFLVMFD